MSEAHPEPSPQGRDGAGGSEGGRARVLVAGLGNVLMGDDAFGPTVARQLEAELEPHPGVCVLDLGTPGLDLTPHLADIEALIVIDTVHSAAAPGTLRLYRRDAILRQPPGPRLSPHDPALKEALLLLDLEGRGPREVLLVGVVPQNTDTGVGLSSAVRASLRPAAAAVMGELARLGMSSVPRSVPVEPELWWEEGGAGGKGR